MKALKIFLVVILVIVLLIIGAVFIFIQNFDLNKYKAQIATQIGEKLKTDVEIGNIDLDFNFGQGFLITVDDIMLADKGLLSGFKVDIEEARLAVDLKKLIRDAEIAIIEVGLREPIVHIDLGKRRQDDLTEKNNFAQTVLKPDSSEIEADLLKLSIHDFHITNGEVVIKADGIQVLQDLEVTDIDVSLKNLILTKGTDVQQMDVIDPFLFTISLSAFDADKVLTVGGKGRVDLSSQQVRFDDVEVKSDLSKLSLGRLTETVAVFNKTGLRNLQGELGVIISQAIVTKDNVPVLLLKGSLTEGKLDFTDLPASVSGINIFCEYSNNNLDILDSSLNFAGGKIDLKGRVDDVLKTQVYTSEIKLSGIDFSQLNLNLPAEVELEGLLNGSAVINGAGFRLPEIAQNLNGTLAFLVDQGKVKNFNLLNYIFNKISIIPDLAQRFEQSLPEDYRQKMRSNVTMFDEAGINMALNKGAVSYTANLVSDTSGLEASGSIDWKNNFNFSGSFMLPETLSNYLIGEIQEFSVLKDRETGEIIIPLKSYTGPLNGFKPFPNIEYLSKKVIVSKAKDEVRNLLGDLIGVNQDEESAPDSEDGQDSQEKPKTEPDIVDTIFDSIFN